LTAGFFTSILAFAALWSLLQSKGALFLLRSAWPLRLASLAHV
jgi:hypothetical protein